ncbi:hypothetical protein FM114_14090 [Luteococcus japonicus LSP_Lj1]|uniref:Uncharacterized protein n=1 Tax=Luteococcus japonicus LSP_Lj1 TaxID=1255658 RepID=A0A1R4KFX3_9ACTN|nr:hypothetical protein FM114_14090 [Luteococcus japonicus LSP_Lj1]
MTSKWHEPPSIWWMPRVAVGAMPCRLQTAEDFLAALDA